jgi:hypothetical protein
VRFKITTGASTGDCSSLNCTGDIVL